MRAGSWQECEDEERELESAGQSNDSGCAGCFHGGKRRVEERKGFAFVCGIKKGCGVFQQG